MSSVLTRAITGTVLVVTITASVLASPYSFIALLLIVDLFALFEFYRLVRAGHLHARVGEGQFVSTSFFVSACLVFSNFFNATIFLINIPLVVLIFIRELYSNAPNPFQNLALTFSGIAYVTLPIILFAGIAFLPLGQGIYHPTIVFGYFIILWASDTGAYAAGKLIGKHKLFERISPKKTWEGSIGGTLSAIGATYMVSLFEARASLRDWLIMSAIIVVMGTYGDLLKSLLKRTAGVKDSGTLLPGHGGFLDRFDSLIGSAPVVFGYLVLFTDWKN
jgi:phosphatidate cytidylyltransferase